VTTQEQIRDFLERGIELSSFEIQRYVPIRGKLPGEVFEYKPEKIPNLYSRIHFCPHSVTHMDLPWGIEKDSLQTAQDGEGVGTIPERPEERIALMEHYSRIEFPETLVLDFSSKADCVKKGYIDSRTGLIDEGIDGNAFEKLMSFLEIKTTEDILALASEGEIRHKFLIIVTNWADEFSRTSHSLDNPFFELRHPYLVYPFLSFETIKWLVNVEKIQGIACETPGIDNPAYYSTPHFAPLYASKYLDNLKPAFRPVSTVTLTNGLYYIMHLANTNLLKEKGILESNRCFGTTCIIPISLGLRDANLVKVIFLEME
jgi:kynurenine formamidase